MKKLFLVISAFALVFSSCSTSSVDPDPVTPVTPPSSVLLSKIIRTKNGTTVTTNLTYNGNKALSAISDNGTSVIYTYTGDLITKIEKFNGTVLTTRNTYAYNVDEKVASYITINYNTSNYGSKYLYVYNSDGTISITKYTGNETSQTVLYNTGKAFFTSGQITKVEEYIPAAPLSPAYTSTSNYVYDTKLNAASNVTGLNKLILQGYSAGLGGNAHNLLSDTRSNGTVTTSTDVSTFTYNASNCPVTETNTSTYNNATGGPTVSTSTAQYFY
jgi:hypothetical protein